MRKILWVIAAPFMIAWSIIRRVFGFGEGRKQTFLGKVAVFVAGTAVWQMIVGGITFGHIRGAFQYVLIALAGLLNLAGWVTKPPEEVSERGQTVMSRIGEKIEGTKEKFEEEFRRRREEAELAFLKKKADL